MPPGSKVAPVLATKVTAMPSATGTSMPMRRVRRLRQAPLKKGPAENSSTGRLSTQLPQFSSCAQVGRQLARAGHVGRRGQHHHLHHAEAGDEQAPQRPPAFSAAQFARRRGGIGRGVVAGTAHRLDQRRRPCALRVPAHRGALAGRADRGLADAVDADQRLFDDAGAGRAVHARQAQRRFGHALAVAVGGPAREALLLQRIVQDRDGRQCGFHA